MYGLIIADIKEFKPVSEFAEKTGSCLKYGYHGCDCIEFSPFGSVRIKAVFCGIGKVNAASAASFLIADGAEIIFSIGLSGGLARFSHDTIVIGSGAFEADFDMTALGYKEFEKPWQEYIHKTDESIVSAAKKALPEAVCGMLAGGDFFLTDAERGKYLFEKYGVVAFDMESAAVAAVCEKCGVKYLILRQVSDNADADASKEYRKNNEQSKPDLLKAILACISYLK